MIEDIDVIILAAGLSRRMGAENKLLMDMGGKPMARQTVELYRRVFSSVHIVLGHEAADIKAALQGLGESFIYNADYAAGHHSSVRYGLKSIKDKKRAVLIALADQPFLGEAELTEYVRAYQDGAGDKAFIPFYQAQRGHPIIIPPALLNAFHAAGEDMTLRRFLDTHPGAVYHYLAPSVNFVKDVDHPDDLE